MNYLSFIRAGTAHSCGNWFMWDRWYMFQYSSNLWLAAWAFNARHTITILWQYFTSSMGRLYTTCILWEYNILYQHHGNCDCDWNCVLQKGSHIIIITFPVIMACWQADIGLVGEELPLACKIGIHRLCYDSRCHWYNQKDQPRMIQSYSSGMFYDSNFWNEIYLGVGLTE